MHFRRRLTRVRSRFHSAARDTSTASATDLELGRVGVRRPRVAATRIRPSRRPLRRLHLAAGLHLGVAASHYWALCMHSLNTPPHISLKGEKSHLALFVSKGLFWAPDSSVCFDDDQRSEAVRICGGVRNAAGSSAKEISTRARTHLVALREGGGSFGQLSTTTSSNRDDDRRKGEQRCWSPGERP